MTLSIRHARIDDLASIVGIYNSTISLRKITADLEPVSVESRQAWFARHHAQRPIYVLEEPRQILGWISFEDFYGRPAYQFTAEVSIYIKEGRRRSGLGEKLLRHAINQSLNLDIERLLAFIFAENEPSLRLFQKYGFVTWGKLPKVARIRGHQHDLCILGLII